MLQQVNPIICHHGDDGGHDDGDDNGHDSSDDDDGNRTSG